ncbi:MAG: hypothetical protein K8S27_01115 [Candidatus Omnitrophica bacterium]|nr:hypothetical protein [Candidatus Omnitrophota bacterium]
MGQKTLNDDPSTIFSSTRSSNYFDFVATYSISSEASVTARETPEKEKDNSAPYRHFRQSSGNLKIQDTN